MTTWSILVLSLGLAMDAAAAAAARGLAAPVLRWVDVLRVSLWFGGFQALMCLLGWFLGVAVGPAVAAWDHWIAFLLLGGLGGKMLWEARGEDNDGAKETPVRDLFATRALFVLAVATSIDALAVGITLPMLNASRSISILLIGGVTAVMSAIAAVLGRHLGRALGARFDVVGGVVLIGLGTKILLEHLGYI